MVSLRGHSTLLCLFCLKIYYADTLYKNILMPVSSIVKPLVVFKTGDIFTFSFTKKSKGVLFCNL